MITQQDLFDLSFKQAREENTTSAIMDVGSVIDALSMYIYNACPILYEAVYVHNTLPLHDIIGLVIEILPLNSASADGDDVLREALSRFAARYTAVTPNTLQLGDEIQRAVGVASEVFQRILSTYHTQLARSMQEADIGKSEFINTRLVRVTYEGH
jgi:hypothetical protein